MKVDIPTEKMKRTIRAGLTWLLASGKQIWLEGRVTFVLLLMVALIIAVPPTTSFVQSQLATARTTKREIVKIGRAMNLAMKMDRVYDAQPELEIDPELIDQGDEVINCWGIATNSEWLCRFILEVVPYFYYEGVRPAQGTHYPRAIVYIPWEEQLHFHLGGRTAIFQGLVGLNYRYINPSSPWYNRSSHVSTVIHELGHVQGIFVRTDDVTVRTRQRMSAWMEASNQVATTEVLAAMSNHGNDYTVKATAGELRSFAMAYLLTKAHEAGREDLYYAFDNHFIHTKPEERAARDKALRYWWGQEEREQVFWRIVDAYESKPYELIRQGLDNHGLAEGLYFTTEDQYLVLDDVKYFLRHWRDYQRQGRKK